ncbi:MAG: hypothetical protein FWE16_00510 [Firmicutes bacterium]|nr:hypothetical protein [Bacillota bacterium]
MEALLLKLDKLIELHKQGKLGGEIMPEDANPKLDGTSSENLLYFTLPMALNYQRNSYKLWQSALSTWNDATTKDIFYPQKVLLMSNEELREKLVKHKVALQPNKQPTIWRTLCETIVNDFDDDLRNLFTQNNSNIANIKLFINANKKKFPYLSGSKILNYWLYVVTNYTGLKLTNKNAITIAPDTHVLQASVKLGIITEHELDKSNIRDITSERWENILKGTKYSPIDLHTPFWLWSRNGFVVEI